MRTKNQIYRKHRGLCAAAILACLSATTGAAPIFTADFNGYTGNQNNTQYQTGLPVAYGGNVTGWSKTGTSTIHAVKLSASPLNWAIMFYQDNVITLATGIAANTLGVTYKVDFDYGTADYAGGQATTAADSLLVEVVRAAGTTLASGTYAPGLWANPANVNLSAGLHGTLRYVGDGSGLVKLRIGPTAPLNTGRFEGEIDNISVSFDPFTINKSTAYEGEAVTLSWNVDQTNVAGTFSYEIKYGNTVLTTGTSPTGTYNTTVPDLAGTNQTVTWTLRAIDTGATTVSSISNVSLSGNPGIPTAVSQSNLNVMATTSSPITLTGSDPNGGILSFTVLTQPTKGTLSGTVPNLTFAAPGGSSGTDQFTFKVNDGKYDSVPGTVVISILPEPTAPTSVGLEETIVDPGTVAGYFISNITTVDINVGEPHTFSLVSGTGSEENANFTILGNQLRAAVNFAGLAGQSQHIRLRSTDSRGLFTEGAFVLSVEQKPRNIVINEIHYNGTDNTINNEFIELYNVGPSTLVLSSWRLSGGIDFVFPANTSMAPGAYLIVAASPPTILTKYGKVALGPWTGRLSSDGETLRLRDGSDAILNEVDYKAGFPWPAAARGFGASMEKINPLLDGSLGGSWRSSTVPAEGALTDTVSPGAINLQFATTAPPAIRNVAHTPVSPVANEPVLITALVTDPDGVASVTLSYQVVLPGSYVRKSDAAFETGWTNVPMVDTGIGGDAVSNDSVFTAVLPATLQTHRALIRYRITVTDITNSSVRVPYSDDYQSNFAYYVYNGAPAWTGRNQPPGSTPTTFPASLMTTLPTYQLIANETDVINSQWNSSFDLVRMWGTLVYDGKVYDHIQFHNKGALSTYRTGKNKWRFHFNRARDFEARDAWGRHYPRNWDTFAMNACASPWNPCFRGWAGLDEVISARIYALAGTPAPAMHHLHFRVVDNAVEAPADQYNGDLWGLYMAVEDPDGSFLDARGLPDGNVYHIVSNSGDKTHQGATHPLGTSDWDAFRTSSGSQTSNNAATEAWWRANLDVPAYINFHACNRITGNVDLREGENHYFYHRGTDNRWLPIPWDLDMMYFPVTHWSGTVIQKNSLLMTGINLEYKNRCRELLDLICADGTATGGQIGQLVDEYKRLIQPAGQAAGWDLLDQYMWNYNPRTVADRTGTFYLPNPTTDAIRQGGPWLRTYSTPDFNGVCSFLINYVTDTDPNTFAVGDGDQRGYGYNFLESEAADAAVPNRPTITSVGTAGFPANDLRFQCSAFSDPQGSDTFAALQWRIGEVASPGVTGYAIGDPFTYEISDVWTSAEITVFNNQIRIPTIAARPGHTYRARVRMKDNTGRWSRWSEPASFAASSANVSVYTASLVISEIMYSPTPASVVEVAAGFGTEDFEYIELRNVGSQPLDLTDVRFTKGVDFDFAPNTVLSAGAATLVVKNAAAFAFRYGAGKPISGSYLTESLKNTGEQLKLSYGAGTAIHDFIYGVTAPWPQGARSTGYAIVLKLPYTLPAHSLGSNWRVGNELGGNPGGLDSLGYGPWAASSGVGGMTEDPDTDALNNLLEYALGSNPNQPSPSSLPIGGASALPGASPPGTYLTLSFRRQRNADDLSYHVEFSSNLSDWDEDGVLVSAVPNDDSTITEVWRSAAPATNATHGYVRLRVTQG